MDLSATVRRFCRQIAGAPPLRLTNLESLAVAETEQEGAELTRAGRRFQVGLLNGVVGIAPVQAIPTTAAQWLLYNSSAKLSAVLDWLGVLLVSGTAGAGIIVVAGLVGPGAVPAAPPQVNAANVKVGPCHNGAPAPNSASSMVVASAQVLALAPPAGWFEIAQSLNTNTAVLSVAAENRDIRGKLIIPPLNGLALAVLSPAGAAPLYAPQASWGEVEVDLE